MFGTNLKYSIKRDGLLTKNQNNEKMKFAKYIGRIIMSMIFLVGVSYNSLGCDKNSFFTLSIPEGWQEKCVHSSEKNTNFPAIALEYEKRDVSLRYQYSYAIIMKGDVDGKKYIPIHVSKDLDTTISENLCYYKNEDFHGMPALSYTFGGATNGVNNVGKIYFVKANGFSIIFVNYFIPNKSGKRQEIDVWKTLKWLPSDK